MNIIVTGASRGIGFELVRVLAARRGHSVLALARNAERLKKLSEMCSEENPECMLRTMAFDLGDLPAVEKELPGRVEAEFDALDILVNNAGMLVNKPITEISASEAIRMMEINFLVPLVLMRALLPLLQKGSRPHVVNIGSMAGVPGQKKFPGLSAYSASKAAVHILTECQVAEFGETGIRFNALALGSVQTEMLAEAFPGFKAPLQPADMAEYIAEFALNGQKVYNGVTLPVALSSP
jgi:NAD(P)-dependent dehydrogenase (short-subunit alcohol dehydrogenase family)